MLDLVVLDPGLEGHQYLQLCRAKHSFLECALQGLFVNGVKVEERTQPQRRGDMFDRSFLQLTDDKQVRQAFPVVSWLNTNHLNQYLVVSRLLILQRYDSIALSRRASNLCLTRRVILKQSVYNFDLFQDCETFVSYIYLSTQS